MAGMMDELLGALGGDGSDIGSVLGGMLGEGADTDAVRAAATSGLGAMLGGLAGNAADEKGATSLLGAIGKDHDGAALDDIGGVLGSKDASADGAKILGHVFGDNKNAVQAKVADQSGLDLGMVTKLLPMLAPIVMGYLGKKTQGDGLDAAGLAGLLQGEAEGLDLGDLGDLLGGESSGLVDGLLGKVRDVIGGN